MRVLSGTSGFSYKEWKGTFYPEDLPDGEMLRHYASRLSAVEINNTFYRMPRAEMLSKWAEQVPDGFRFALKASQQITHRKRLKDAAESVAYFFQIAVTLGDRMGPVLFQLPPNLKKDLARLSDFLAVLAPASRCAFEFRHESWFEEDVFEALRARGCALCVAEDEDLATPFVSTADWGYLRLRRQDYTGEDLRERASKLLAQPWSEAFAFFKHEEEGTGPRLASQFLGLLA
ncbi:MAG TPA: DUF72 domain-containing protein [Thermoanaerobaculia bacterium]|nr:DUF72 domain-containing protein [Thermoanaerobaculia bacterium]